MATIPVSHQDIIQAKGLSFVTTVRPDNLLSVHPVSVIVDGDELRFSTLKGRGKLRNLAQDSRLSVCMPDPANPLRFVELRGHARMEPDPDRTFINRIAREFMGIEHYPYDRPGAERVTIVMKIEQVWAPLVQG